MSEWHQHWHDVIEKLAHSRNPDRLQKLHEDLRRKSEIFDYRIKCAPLSRLFLRFVIEAEKVMKEHNQTDLIAELQAIQKDAISLISTLSSRLPHDEAPPPAPRPTLTVVK